MISFSLILDCAVVEKEQRVKATAASKECSTNDFMSF